MQNKEILIDYFGKQYSIHDYIRLNICANRGTDSKMYKEDLVKLAEERNLPVDKKETKETLFDKLTDAGISDAEWEVFGSVGVVSKQYQDTFGITHQDVKRLEKAGALTVVGTYTVRNYGRYLDVPLYSLSQFAEMDEIKMQELLEKYPKGKKIKKPISR